jgi:hypothetical protein
VEGGKRKDEVQDMIIVLKIGFTYIKRWHGILLKAS